MSKKTMSSNLTRGPVLPVLLKSAVPILIANLLSTIYNLVDMAIVGRYVGSVALSAVSIGSDIMHIITISSNGLSNATQVQVAKLAAVNDKQSLNKLIGSNFTFFGLFSVGLTILLLIFAKPILVILNTPERAMADAMSYTATCYLGIIFVTGYAMIGSMLRGMGDSKHPMVFIAVSSVANLLLDLLFVPVLGLGAFGAALATVMGQGLSFVWALSFLYRRKEQFGFDFKPASFKPDRELMGKFLRLGIPMLLQNMSVQLSSIFINSFVYAYGVEVTAIGGIGAKLATISHVICNSLTRGGAVMISQSVSLGKYERVRKVVFFNLAFSAAVASAASILAISWPYGVFGLFTDDPKVLEWVPVFLPVLIVRFYAFASRCPSVALINGVGKPSLNFVSGLIDGIVMRIGLSMVFGYVFNMGVSGFWYGNAIGSFGAFIIGGIYFVSGKWKQVK